MRKAQFIPRSGNSCAGTAQFIICGRNSFSRGIGWTGRTPGRDGSDSGREAVSGRRLFPFRSCPFLRELGEYPLNDAYIGLRSLTYAQRAARFLSGLGMPSSAARAPWSGGCAYAVRLRRGDLEKAVEKYSLNASKPKE